jgi:protein tyrosine phosphatase (PTP) superfamily phosphohydrolase (DUF442 family)
MTGFETDQIANLLHISETLATSGQPTPEQFEAIAAAGYALVVNLALSDSPGALPDEPRLVEALGMDHVHIPVVWEAPTMRDLETFFRVMDRHRGKRVWAHCVVNKRVSAFVFLYRVIRLGKAEEEARVALRQIWEPDGVWEDFVRRALARHGLADGGWHREEVAP